MVKVFSSTLRRHKYTCTVIRFVLVNVKFGACTVVGIMGHLQKLKCIHSRIFAFYLQQVSHLYPVTVQMLNVALIETKRITVCAISYNTSNAAVSDKFRRKGKGFLQLSYRAQVQQNNWLDRLFGIKCGLSLQILIFPLGSRLVTALRIPIGEKCKYILLYYFYWHIIKSV